MSHAWHDEEVESFQNEVAALEAENARLREALEKAGREAKRYLDQPTDNPQAAFQKQPGQAATTLEYATGYMNAKRMVAGRFERIARAALSGPKPEPEGRP